MPLLVKPLLLLLTRRCRLQDAERYGYFVATVTRMVTKLSNIPRTLWVGLNSRADWSPSQLQGAKKILVPAVRKPSLRAKNLALPNIWDWRSSGLDKVTPAKDQGRCGSCFAFASVAAVESKLLIQYNRTARTYPIDLSEQQVVDCVAGGPARYLSNGCNGGYLEEPLDYTARCACCTLEVVGCLVCATSVVMHTPPARRQFLASKHLACFAAPALPCPNLFSKQVQAASSTLLAAGSSS